MGEKMPRNTARLFALLLLSACSTSPDNASVGAASTTGGSASRALARAVALDNLCPRLQFDQTVLNSAAVSAGYTDGDAAIASFNAPGALDAAKAGLTPSANYCAVASEEFGLSGTAIPGLLVNS